MIIQIKNAGDAGHDRVTLSYSKLKHSVADVLQKENFLKKVSVKGEGTKKSLVIDLFLDNRTPKVRGVSRISKPSKRVYKKSSDIRPVKNGYGALILSTSKGVMSGRDAKKAQLGGEALFTIW